MSDLPFTKKSLGQHWLLDVTALQAICDAAKLSAEDLVLEIGSGPGSLTEQLAQRARQVIAVEFDAQLAHDLPKRVPANNLEIRQRDILSFDFASLQPDYKIVANIPYYLTSNLIRVISETPNPPRTAVLLVQQEVAQRAAAGAGQMSLLSVSAQFYWQVSLGPKIDAELFMPPPKVDSQVLILERRPEPLFADVDAKLFFRLVKAGFGQRRKTLLNSLSAGLRLDKSQITALLAAATIDPKLRPQNLSLDQWYMLYNAYTKVI